MALTLPDNLIYFSILEILLGFFLILFTALQIKYKFRIPMDSRYQRKGLLTAFLAIFFIIIAIQLHLELPQNIELLKILYKSVAFTAVCEIIKLIIERVYKIKKTSISLRHAGLIIISVTFIYIGFKTLFHQISG